MTSKRSIILIILILPLISLFGGFIILDGKMGNTEVIKIGSQTWMTKNLNVLYFRNGEPIPIVKSAKEWENCLKYGKPACCFYMNNYALGDDLGVLYNWHAVNDKRGLAPFGFHIPKKEEFEILVETIGGKGDLASLKSTSHWLPKKGNVPCSHCENWSQEEKALKVCLVCKDNRHIYGKRLCKGSNSSGFNAIPAGFRGIGENGFGGKGFNCMFWSADELLDDDQESGYYAYAFHLDCYSYTIMFRPKFIGMSIRCLKDD